MYGYFRLEPCKLSASSTAIYRKLYCGHCGNIQRNYGYAFRALVSRDTTFLGLLVSAQQDAEDPSSHIWCAVAPQKKVVFSVNANAQRFAGALSVLIPYIKLRDAISEKDSLARRAALKVLSINAKRSLAVLGSLKCPTPLLEKAITEQQASELNAHSSLADLYYNTANTLGEAFRSTALIAENTNNGDVLYEIGYLYGKIIYLVDSCVDLLDDLSRSRFNVLIAAYGTDDEVVGPRAKSEVTNVILDSQKEIDNLTKRLKLNRYEEIVANISGGFKKHIASILERSYRSIVAGNQKSHRFLAVENLPHAALSAALCAMSNPSFAAADDPDNPVACCGQICGIGCQIFGQGFCEGCAAQCLGG
jgi:hypothetical protein